MYIDYMPKAIEVENVLDNLSELTKDELILSFGKDYRDKLINILSISKCLYLIKLKKDNTSVGMFGLIEEDKKTGGIFFLSTNEIYQGNMIKLLKTSKIIIDEWLEEYETLFDDCHQENLKVKKWLEFLGFKPTEEIKDGGFIEYQKVRENA